MPLSVLGLGMISPLARSATEHAFFLRAGVVPATPGAFRDAEGKTVHAAYCPWLGASLPPGERIVALATSAIGEAMTPLLARRREGTPLPSPRIALFGCTSAPWEGLTETDRGAVEARLATLAGARATVRATGAAGVFQALGEAETLLLKGDHQAALVVAADTMISPPALARLAEEAFHPWVGSPPRPAEGAAALLVATDEAARALSIPVLGRIVHVASLPGKGHDDDDALVDGAAMTVLLRGVPSNLGPIAAAFGQQGTDWLRTQEWHFATARNAARFQQEALFEAIEPPIGLLGAAAGAMNLAWALGARQHRSWERIGAGDGRSLAWAISRDGLRGLAVVE